MSDIRDCPWCYRTAEYSPAQGQVRCTGCGASGPTHVERDWAVENWNDMCAGLKLLVTILDLVGQEKARQKREHSLA